MYSGIHHWRNFKGTYKKFAWVELKHWIPYRRSNRLSYQVMSSTRSQGQLCTATPISSLCSVSRFILVLAFVSRHIYFKRSLAQVIMLLVEWIVRSEHSVYHGIHMTTYLAQHWISCISLNSAARPNFKEKKNSEVTEEDKMRNLR